MPSSRRVRHRLVVAIAIALSAAALASDPLTPAGPTKLFGLAVSASMLAIHAALGRARTTALSNHAPLFSTADLAGLGFLGLSALSLLWGTRAGLVDLALWTTGLAIVSALRRRALGFRVRVLEATAALTCGASAIYAIIERFLHRETTGGHGNPDWLGLALAMGLPICVDFARKERRRPVGALLVGLVLGGLYLSHSRTGWLAAGVATLVVLLSIRARTSSATKALFAAPGLGGHLGAFREADAARAWTGRLWIYQRSAEAAWAHPISGVGLGRFGFGYLDAQGRALARLPTQEAARGFINATTAHDDYLQVASESGIPSALLFVLFLARSAAALLARRTFGALGALVAFAICALGDSPLRLPVPVLLLALSVACSRDTPPRFLSARAPMLRRPLRILAGAVPVLAIVSGIVAASLYTSARLRTRAALSGSLAQGKLLVRATQLDLTGEAELDLGLYRLAQGVSQAAGAEHHLRASSTRLPNAGTFVALGNALSAQKRNSEAKDAYERALALNPGSLKAHLNLAETNRRLGMLQEAKHHAEQAKLIAPYHPKLLDLFDRLESDTATSEELEWVDVDDDTNGPR